MGGSPIYAGEQFGLLTAVRRADKHLGGRLRACWLCRCECGAESVVESGNLRRGNSTRCRACANKSRSVNQATHGHTRNRAPTKLYYTWQAMLSRCENPKNKRYADYGGRGVTVDPRWRSFEAFASDMGEPPTADYQLERKDNGCGYGPGNCVWATRVAQARNKRNNIVLTHLGKTQTLPEWCEELGLSYGTVKQRLRKGWSTEEALQSGDLRRAR